MQRTKTFSVSIRSDLDDQIYSGKFTTKKLTIMDLSKMGMIRAQLSGGLVREEVAGTGVDLDTASINEMIAHCQVALTDKPEWFIIEDLIDLKIVHEVYKEVATFEASFFRRASEVEAGSGETSSGEESERSGGGTSTIENLVDQKVPKISALT